MNGLETKSQKKTFLTLSAVAPNRWVLQGTFHEGDTRFPEDHRNKQGTPMAIVALAMAHVRDADDWTPSDVDDVSFILLWFNFYTILIQF